MGNKADLARSRLLQTTDGCDLAVEFGVKFTETSPGMGHHIDELLVGIVMQMRYSRPGLELPSKNIARIAKRCPENISSVVKVSKTSY